MLALVTFPLVYSTAQKVGQNDMYILLFVLTIIPFENEISDLGPPQVSAKFGSSGMGGRDAPRGGGDRMGGGGGSGNGYGGDRMSGGDRMNGGGDRYPPSYDRGYEQRYDRGYGGGGGGGGGYDRPAPIYREERREREPTRDSSRDPHRYDPRSRQRSPPQSAYYDDRRSGIDGYDDRYLYHVLFFHSLSLSL